MMTMTSNDPQDTGRPSPHMAIWLGYAGLIPFVISAAAVLLFDGDPFVQETAGQALVTYGAVILSFLALGQSAWCFTQGGPDPGFYIECPACHFRMELPVAANHFGRDFPADFRLSVAALCRSQSHTQPFFAAMVRTPAPAVDHRRHHRTAGRRRWPSLECSVRRALHPAGNHACRPNRSADHRACEF